MEREKFGHNGFQRHLCSIHNNTACSHGEVMEVIALTPYGKVQGGIARCKYAEIIRMKEHFVLIQHIYSSEGVLK